MKRYLPIGCDGCKHHRWVRVRIPVVNPKTKKTVRKWVQDYDYCSQVDDGYTNDCLLAREG